MFLNQLFITKSMINIYDIVINAIPRVFYFRYLLKLLKLD